MKGEFFLSTVAKCLLTEDCVNIGLLSLIEDNNNNSVFKETYFLSHVNPAKKKTQSDFFMHICQMYIFVKNKHYKCSD